jgi:RNA polymerase sigma factor (sigma-70 family)
MKTGGDTVQLASGQHTVPTASIIIRSMDAKRTAELDAQLVELVEANQRILHAISRAACPHNIHEREDLCQEITIRALTAYPSFRHESKFSTWLRKIALNTVSVWKRGKKKLEIDWREDVPDLPEEPAQDTDPDNRIDRLFESGDLWDRIILALYLDGEENAAIAEALGVKADTIRKRLDRLKKRV